MEDNTGFRLVACGGREYTDRDFIHRTLARLHLRRRISLLIHSEAAGAAKIAGEWARGMAIHTAEVAALPCHRTAAAAQRNRAMLLLNPDGVLAFPGGEETANMIRLADKAGITAWKPAVKTMPNS